MRDTRIQKAMADMGLCSRRQAEQIILEGRVKLNGRPVKLGDKMDMATDLLSVDGQTVRPPKQKDLFGGAASSGASITPVGFLVINGTSVKFMQVAEGNRTIDRLINMMPEVIDKLEALIGKKTKKEPELVPADVNEETF